MKRSIKNPFIHLVLAVGLCLMLAGRATAQTFTNLHYFTGTNGFRPQGELVLSGGTLFGVTLSGGTWSEGTVFVINTDGAGFKNLYDFSPVNQGTNADGANPLAGILLSDNTLYGTTTMGGTSGSLGGTVFAVEIDGTGFTNLHNFQKIVPPCPCTNSGGAYSSGTLVLSGNMLYGTTTHGGTSGSGTVFAINTNGTDFRTLYTFASNSGSPAYTNTDGAYPSAGLVLSSNTLYGTTAYGGVRGIGTVFRVNIDGTAFTNLHNFSATNNFSPFSNGDGARPSAGLILLSNTLYGTATSGGRFGSGSIFKLNTDGTDFGVLHDFAATGSYTSLGDPTNEDGVNPRSRLVLVANMLYGTAASGGKWGSGTVFALNPDGTAFTNLYNFSEMLNYTNSEGATPVAGLTLFGSTLYGTTRYGGSSADGTVFSISLQVTPSPLTIMLSQPQVVLSWPIGDISFKLQSTTDLVSPVWTTNFPTPVIVNGQNTVTNPISGNQQFFRLSQ